MAASSMSKSFFEFVKSIGEAKSKQEEDKIVEAELVKLKEKMGGKSVGDAQMREYLIRMVYCEMLGHESNFGHIHAVKSTRATKLVDKRVGYLACSLCLHKDHELMLLLVGGLQNDLASKNVLEVATALIVSCKLINVDTIPAVIPLVNKLLAHSEATIRKKAIMTVQRFWELSPDTVPDISDKAKRMLCDKDPSVMGASLHLLCELFQTQDINEFKDLVSSFVSILKQIIEHRLPKDYDYHRMPAPWIQVCLLQILGALGEADKVASEGMYEVLHEVMRRADIGINVGYAIIYECVRTVTQIYPNQALLAEAAKCTSRFIGSDNHNLKYLGINALASIVQVNPSAANEHQMVVIDCLEDKDETLRRKTLDLLYRMTNEKNVSVVCTKLLGSLRDSVDVFLRQELVEKITSLSEKFAPDTLWYIETMVQVFDMGGDLVPEQTIHNFITHMAGGVSESAMDEEHEDEEVMEDEMSMVENSAIAQYVADYFLLLLKKPRIPDLLLCVIAWVLGEYGHLATGHLNLDEDGDDEAKQPDPSDMIDTTQVLFRLWEAVDKKHDSSARVWALLATGKLFRYLDEIPNEIRDIIDRFKTSLDSGLQQLAFELNYLISESEDKSMLGQAYPDGSLCGAVMTGDFDIDSDLSFLNDFVNEAISNGAPEYQLPSLDDDGAADMLISDGLGGPSTSDGGLKFEHRQSEAQSLITEKAIGAGPERNLPASLGGVSAAKSSGDGGSADRNSRGRDEDVDAGTGFSFGGARAKRGGGSGMWGESGFTDGSQGQSNVDSDTDDYRSGDRTIVDDAYSSRGAAASSASAAVDSSDVATSGGASSSGVSDRHGSRDNGGGVADPPPRELTEKEKMARALFAGDASAGKRKRGPIRRKPLKKPSFRAKRTAAAKTGASEADSAAASAPTTITVSQDEPASAPDSGGDLLDLLGGPAPPASDAAAGIGSSSAKPSSASSGGGDLIDDLFGGSVAAPPSAAAAPSSTGPVDLFSDITSGSGSGTGSSMMDGLFGDSTGGQASSPRATGPRGLLAIPDLKIKLSAFKWSDQSDQVLASHSNAQLSALKVYKPSQSTLCLFVSNVGTSAMDGVRIAVKCNTSILAHMSLGIDAANSVPKPSLVNARTGDFGSVKGGETVCQMAAVGALNPLALPLPVNVDVSVSFSIDGHSQQMSAQLALQAKDMVRPLGITTDVFSQHWVKFPPTMQVMAVVSPSSCRSIDDYVQRISKLNIHPIQCIGQECVSASRIQSASNASQFLPLFIHGKVDPSSVTVMVRSQNMAAARALLLEMQQSLI